MVHCVDPQKDALLQQPAKTLYVSAGILIDSAQKILLAKRPKGKDFADFWEFPGGKVRPQEAPEMALIRELDEELGITVSSGCLLPFSFVSHRYDTFHLVMMLFSCRNWQGQPEGIEGQQLTWAAANELKNYPMPQANAAVLSMIRDFF